MLTNFYEIIKLLILVLKSRIYDLGVTKFVLLLWTYIVATLPIYIKSNFKGASNFQFSKTSYIPPPPIKLLIS